MATKSAGWKPKLRLRHIHAVALRTVALPPNCSCGSRVFYQIHLVPKDKGTEPQLLYTSDKLLLQPSLFWDAIDWEHSCLAWDMIHAPLHGEISLSFHATTRAYPSNRSANAHTTANDHSSSSSSKRAVSEGGVLVPPSTYGSQSSQQHGSQSSQQQEHEQQQESWSSSPLGAGRCLEAGEQQQEKCEEGGQDLYQQQQKAHALEQGLQQQQQQAGSHGNLPQDSKQSRGTGVHSIRQICTKENLISEVIGADRVYCLLVVEDQNFVRLQLAVAAASSHTGAAVAVAADESNDRSSSSRDRKLGGSSRQAEGCSSAGGDGGSAGGSLELLGGAPATPRLQQPKAASNRQPQQQQQQQSHQQSKKHRSTTAAAAAAAAAAALKHPPGSGGPVLFAQKAVHFDHLVPLPAYRLKEPSEEVNQAVLAIGEGLYALPEPPAPAPSADTDPAAAAAAADTTATQPPRRTAFKSGGGDDGAEYEWTQVEAEDALLRSQGSFSGRQQQVFRWMASSYSVLDALDAAYSSQSADFDYLLLPREGASSTPLLVTSASSSMQAGGGASAGVGSPRLGIRGFINNVFGMQGRGSSVDGSSPGTSQGNTPSRPSAAADVGGGEEGAASYGGGGSGLVRCHDLDEFIAHTQRLMTQHEQLRELTARCEQLQRKLASELHEQHAPIKRRQLRLAAAQAAAARQQALRQARQQQLALAREGIQQRKLQLEAAAVALKASDVDLRKSKERLTEAERVLAGPEGLGVWRKINGQLVTRRSRLVADLAAAYQMGPSVSSILSGPPLADKLDLGWWSSGSSSHPQHTNSSNDSSSSNGGPGSGHSWDASRKNGEGARLLVAGLELSPQLAKRGLEGSMGWDGAHHDEEQRVAAALGYVAHMVGMLAAYLDVPLRFPVQARSSRSMVMDLAPLRQQLLEGPGTHPGPGHDPRHHPLDTHNPKQRLPPFSRPAPPAAGPAAHHPLGGLAAAAAAALGGSSGAAAGAAAAAAGGGGPADVPALKLPLYYEAGDRTRFAYGIFLLNKDVEQLLSAHGLDSNGANQLMANLYKLITVAKSALPQQGLEGQGGFGDGSCGSRLADARAGQGAAAGAGGGRGQQQQGSGAGGPGPGVAAAGAVCSGATGGPDPAAAAAEAGGPGGGGTILGGCSQVQDPNGPAVWDWYDQLPLPPA